MWIKKPRFLQISLFYALLVTMACAPIWYVDRYLNQDGIPHLYNAYLIVELLKGNESIRQFAALNTYPIPNLTGHWILAFFVMIFGATFANKIMATFTFGAFVASAGWLRYRTAGESGIRTSILLGTVIAFNWLWFLGFYNFILAATAFAFTLGLWWKWRNAMTAKRSFILWLCLVFTFFSHLISFFLLGFAILFLAILDRRKNDSKSLDLYWTLTAIAGAAPLVLLYVMLGISNGSFSPRWMYLENLASLTDWLWQIKAADPFLLINRKSLPFITVVSPFFAVFSSSLWLLTAILLLLFSTLLRKEETETGNISISSGWILLVIIFGLIGAFAPDDFGKAHGGFLRERAVILAAVCFIPFFKFGNSKYQKLAAQFCLLFIITFQTLVLLEFSIWSDSTGKRLLAANEQIGQNESIGSIIFEGGTRRFMPRPIANLPTFLGIGKNAPVWDNYELGYYLFPVTARTPESRSFAFEFNEASKFDLNDPNEDYDGKRLKLQNILEKENYRIDVLLVWNEQPGFDSVRKKWFEDVPYFESSELKLYRHR